MRGDCMKPPKKHRISSAPALEWICDLSGKTARITSIGNRQLLVENHCGIRRYSESSILLATRCGCVEVTGSALSLCEVRRDALVIRGSIGDIKLPGMEADDHES